ncbi:transcription factor UPBEAT1-like [Macadamia integrifolia]|uniref:transcription factor UPBEAT1-like n=1 Tax=Macadamia integrifolia TaxID=60698 RepID=UPI001C52C682|nr:transcription factor UPBEAT1-like [Macadamia integrifolia]
MGASLHPILASLDLKDMFPESASSGTDPLWCKSLKARAIRRRRMKKRNNGGRILMKRKRVLLGGHSRMPTMNGMERKVRTLKKLIPNGRSTPLMGLDGLFRQATDYILSLQMKVKVMQVMVKELSGSDE